MNTNNTTWTTDNRYGANNSGATAPLDSPAAYAARWIDQGDDRMADVLHDRQGFAYNDKADMERLITAMGKAGDALRTPYKVNLAHDETRIVMNTPEWECYMRRAGGYIYVDAWLVPAIPEPPAADVKASFDFEVNDGPVSYRPWTNGYAVGFEVHRSDGRIEFIYLNPSQSDGDEAEANVFLYTGTEGDPSADEAHHHYLVDETDDVDMSRAEQANARGWES